MDQEEIFYVISGEIRFETSDEELTVSEGEIASFHPDEYQRGRNVCGERATILDFRSPKKSKENVRSGTVKTVKKKGSTGWMRTKTKVL